MGARGNGSVEQAAPRQQLVVSLDRYYTSYDGYNDILVMRYISYFNYAAGSQA